MFGLLAFALGGQIVFGLLVFAFDGDAFVLVLGLFEVLVVIWAIVS